MSNLTQFRASVAAQLRLDNSTTGDQTYIDQRLNEGVVDILLETGCKVASATTTLTSGTADYTLDTAILLIKDATTTSGSQTYPLEQVSPGEILRFRQATTSQGSPVLRYALNGSNLLMVYPTPAAADTITLYYVPRPATLALAVDTPSEIPSEFHPAVEAYALWRMADYADDQSSGQGERYRALYEGWLKKIRKFVNRKGNVRLPRATVGRTRNMPRTNSTDWR